MSGIPTSHGRHFVRPPIKRNMKLRLLSQQLVLLQPNATITDERHYSALLPILLGSVGLMRTCVISIHHNILLW
jgi:hypothetical protein